MASFPLAYIFKSTEVFKFVNIYCKELFFWEDCLRPAIILKDFSLSLLVVMVRNASISIVEVGKNQIYKLVNDLDVLRRDYIL